ncbi:hypothetical protein L4D06_13755 [Enterovibrio makurazakiensis]|uniref:Uncharacterized protein n=1 Tax=Enterovibrio gelatinilyticus TaxID=2899819 RepID=A0ABT5R094_9GAMM|nr:hypothetical protein [Enterovibrio sp. ZSDZ42]MDD1793674.1 hypothetical protein [Enterovibrio sp. ZSDZ42]
MKYGSGNTKATTQRTIFREMKKGDGLLPMSKDDLLELLIISLTKKTTISPSN